MYCWLIIKGLQQIFARTGFRAKSECSSADRAEHRRSLNIPQASIKDNLVKSNSITIKNTWHVFLISRFPSNLPGNWSMHGQVNKEQVNKELGYVADELKLKIGTPQGWCTYTHCSSYLDLLSGQNEGFNKRSWWRDWAFIASGKIYKQTKKSHTHALLLHYVQGKCCIHSI